MFKIQLTKSALKAFQKINNPFKDIITEKINTLSVKGLNMNNIKALVGEFKGLYRLRSGDYRIVFDMDNEFITIIAIHHRKNVYK